MPIDYLTVAARETRNLEPELADGGTHSIHGTIVLPWIASIRNELLNGPKYDIGLDGCGHMRP